MSSSNFDESSYGGDLEETVFEDFYYLDLTLLLNSSSSKTVDEKNNSIKNVNKSATSVESDNHEEQSVNVSFEEVKEFENDCHNFFSLSNGDNNDDADRQLDNEKTLNKMEDGVFNQPEELLNKSTNECIKPTKITTEEIKTENNILSPGEDIEQTVPVTNDEQKEESFDCADQSTVFDSDSLITKNDSVTGTVKEFLHEYVQMVSEITIDEEDQKQENKSNQTGSNNNDSEGVILSSNNCSDNLDFTETSELTDLAIYKNDDALQAEEIIISGSTDLEVDSADELSDSGRFKNSSFDMIDIADQSSVTSLDLLGVSPMSDRYESSENSHEFIENIGITNKTFENEPNVKLIDITLAPSSSLAYSDVATPCNLIDATINTDLIENIELLDLPIANSSIRPEMDTQAVIEMLCEADSPRLLDNNFDAIEDDENKENEQPIEPMITPEVINNDEILDKIEPIEINESALELIEAIQPSEITLNIDLPDQPVISLNNSNTTYDVNNSNESFTKILTGPKNIENEETGNNKIEDSSVEASNSSATPCLKSNKKEQSFKTPKMITRSSTKSLGLGNTPTSSKGIVQKTSSCDSKTSKTPQNKPLTPYVASSNRKRNSFKVTPSNKSLSLETSSEMKKFSIRSSLCDESILEAPEDVESPKEDKKIPVDCNEFSVHEIDMTTVSTVDHISGCCYTINEETETEDELNETLDTADNHKSLLQESRTVNESTANLIDVTIYPSSAKRQKRNSVIKGEKENDVPINLIDMTIGSFMNTLSQSPNEGLKTTKTPHAPSTLKRSTYKSKKSISFNESVIFDKTPSSARKTPFRRSNSINRTNLLPDIFSPLSPLTQSTHEIFNKNQQVASKDSPRSPLTTKRTPISAKQPRSILKTPKEPTSQSAKKTPLSPASTQSSFKHNSPSLSRQNTQRTPSVNKSTILGKRSSISSQSSLDSSIENSLVMKQISSCTKESPIYTPFTSMVAKFKTMTLVTPFNSKLQGSLFNEKINSSGKRKLKSTLLQSPKLRPLATKFPSINSLAEQSNLDDTRSPRIIARSKLEYKSKIPTVGGSRIPVLKSSVSVAQGSSTTSGKTSHTSIVDNAVFFAEKSLRVAEEKVKRAEQNLKIAKDMKDTTSSKLQTTVQSNRNVSAQDTIQKLISIAKAEDDSAKNNLRVAEDKVRRTKENLKSAEYALELAKGSKK